jgi:hypothetical protein
MASTDARTGFRLPWSSEDRPQSEHETETSDGAAASDDWPAPVTAEAPAVDPATQPTSDSPSPVAPTVDAAPAPSVDLPAKPSRARPSKFLAELTKAMQTAAEAAREETLARFQAEAKSHIEEIHARSADDATSLRRSADEDVAAIRDWSKAEIARIREETENRISGRKSDLEHELEAHAARIERRIERVHGAVAAFEGEMASFFERLLAEEDPTRFAAMAEHLPEPAPFGLDGDDAPVATASVAPEPVVETVAAVPESAVEITAEPVEAVAEVVTAQAAAEDTMVAEDTPVAEDTMVAEVVDSATSETASAEPVAESATTDDATPRDEETTEPAELPVDEGTWAAESSAVTPVEPVVDEPAAVADLATESEGTADAPAGEPVADLAAEPVDPRLAALAMTTDAPALDDAAFAVADGSEEFEEIPTIADDALAARLADLVHGSDDEATPETITTRVVVTGLVSVASIASFKRHLGRLEAVQGVGVTSGPEGEFVFAVSHGRDASIRDSIPTLPGFQARVTGAEDGVVHVSAHDPEAEG